MNLVNYPLQKNIVKLSHLYDKYEETRNFPNLTTSKFWDFADKFDTYIQEFPVFEFDLKFNCLWKSTKPDHIALFEIINPCIYTRDICQFEFMKAHDPKYYKVQIFVSFEDVNKRFEEGKLKEDWHGLFTIKRSSFVLIQDRKIIDWYEAYKDNPIYKFPSKKELFKKYGIL